MDMTVFLKVSVQLVKNLKKSLREYKGYCKPLGLSSTLFGQMNTIINVLRYPSTCRNKINSINFTAMFARQRWSFFGVYYISCLSAYETFLRVVGESMKQPTPILYHSSGHSRAPARILDLKQVRMPGFQTNTSSPPKSGVRKWKIAKEGDIERMSAKRCLVFSQIFFALLKCEHVSAKYKTNGVLSLKFRTQTFFRTFRAISDSPQSAFQLS